MLELTPSEVSRTSDEPVSMPLYIEWPLAWRSFPVTEVRIPRDRESWAKRNHDGLTLEELKERGGVCPCEAIAILERRAWRNMSVDESIAAIQQWMS